MLFKIKRSGNSDNGPSIPQLLYQICNGNDESSNQGNTLNCNHPVVMELILVSLRHWVEEYHVDGFRFDVASVFCRGIDGAPLNAPPFIKVYIARWGRSWGTATALLRDHWSLLLLQGSNRLEAQVREVQGFSGSFEMGMQGSRGFIYALVVVVRGCLLIGILKKENLIGE
ncbi:hypothetical protein J5N97_001838 [Dioscorea zingiberensis]|uniref:Uncharacterized protein n=1 Tax=Dioscorea zingiberensis TaxID=325984 RepID=A0A9D5BTM2_9LILI|nr:hypothetical protein J5N97_001838 [Dioscorea zingiberensis]